MFSNIFAFQTGQHFKQSKLVVSGHYSSCSSYMPILIKVQQLIPLLCIKTDLVMSLPARTINKTGHKCQIVLVEVR